MRNLLLFSLCCAMLACTSSDGSRDTKANTAESDQQKPTPKTVASSTGPAILHSSVNINSVDHPEDLLTFTLVVSDNGGVDSLAGAVLMDEVTGATYGGFSAGAEKGTYTLSLRKFEIEKVRPLEPSTTGEEQRAFKAVVFNTSHASASVILSVNLKGQTKYVKISSSFYDQLPTEFKVLSVFNTEYVGQDEFYFECKDWKVRYDTGSNSSVVDITQFSRSNKGQIIFRVYDSPMVFTQLQDAFGNLGFGLSDQTQDSWSAAFRVDRFGVRCIQRQNTERSCWAFDL